MAFIQFIKTIECAQCVYNTRNFMQVFFFLTGLALKVERLQWLLMRLALISRRCTQDLLIRIKVVTPHGSPTSL